MTDILDHLLFQVKHKSILVLNQVNELLISLIKLPRNYRLPFNSTVKEPALPDQTSLKNETHKNSSLHGQPFVELSSNLP